MNTSSSSTADVPPPAHLVPFAQSTLQLLHTWPALSLSLLHSPPKPPATPASLLSELASELVGAFLDSAPPDGLPSREEVEDFLLGWVFAELDVRVEDDSEVLVARDLESLWVEWRDARGVEGALPKGGLVERIRASAGKKLQFDAAVEEGDTSDEGESGDEDDQMEIDAPAEQPARRDKEEPEVDADGFTVVKKGRR